MENYKTTKTIRFKLDVNQNSSIRKDIPKNIEPNLSQLVNLGFQIVNHLENYVFFEEKKEINENTEESTFKMLFDKAGINTNQKTTKKLSVTNSIKTNFLKDFFKREFYEWLGAKKPEGQYSLSKVKFLDEKIKNVIEKMNNSLDSIKDYANQNASGEHHNLKRRSNINLLVLELANKQNFQFIKSFMENLKLKNQSNRELEILKEFEKELKIATDYYRPSQSSGLVIAKASFNYYTLNKKQIDFNNEIDNISKENKIKIIERKYQDNKTLKDKIKKEIPYIRIRDNQLKQCILDKLLQSFSGTELTKENLKEWLKLEKARQKSKINELLQKQISSGEFNLQKKDLFLFEQLTIENWNKLLDLVKEKNNKDKGKLLTSKEHWKQYIDFYKQVSREYGNLKSKLAGIDKEKVESQMLKYWALILQEGDKRRLVLIPREKAKSFKEKLGKIPTATNEENQLIYFESLTYRSLQKLCFGNPDTNTFAPGIRSEINVQDGEYKFKENEQQKICFYQKVLQTKHARNSLSLDWEKIDNDIVKPHFESLDAFKIALEKITYKKYAKISDDNDLLKNDDVLILDINSQDLNLQKENKEYHKDKNHTKIWNEFWGIKNADNDIRLNPEIAISYRRAKQLRIDKYGKDSANYNPNKKNRYLQEQFTLITTISENCLSKERNLSFKTDEELKKHILEFNKQFNEEYNNKINYSLGIDVGTKDLAYATLIEKSDKHRLGYLPKTITAYKVKDLKYHKPNKNGNEYYAINNLSYFLNENLFNNSFSNYKFEECRNELFEEKPLSSFNLTISKVVNDKLIINGDYHALLNLKILHAKRQIYQKLIDNIEFSFDDEFFKEIYFHSNEFEYISFKKKDGIQINATIENVKQELKDYFDEQQETRKSGNNKEKEDILLESYINNARNALVANMIGVIDFIRKQCECYIVLEDLKQSVIESHRITFNGDITRSLEFKLYQKMQNYGFVPPIKGIVELRERDKKCLKQVGIVRFVNEGETSLICPNCGEKAYAKSDDFVYNCDKKQGIFKCEEYEILSEDKKTKEVIRTREFYPKNKHEPCGFHNKNNAKEFTDLTTNDAVAAFNIAKNGFKNFK